MPSPDTDQASAHFEHTSVLLDGAVDALVHQPDGVYLDGTFGRGGHSRVILSRLNDAGRLIALDRDPQAVAAAAAITDTRFTMVQRDFARLAEVAHEQGVHGKLAGILLDVGVSSPQLDDPERGFSFMRNGPLDMRMDPTQEKAPPTSLLMPVSRPSRTYLNPTAKNVLGNGWRGRW